MNVLVEDPIGLDNYTDPYPRYQQLRRESPVLWHEPTRTWFFFRHADVNALLRSRSVGTTPFQPRQGDAMPSFGRLMTGQMLKIDPPDHTRLRALVSPWFLRGRLQEFRPLVREITEEILGDGISDFVTDLAVKIPPRVLGAALAIPEEDVCLLQPWSIAMVRYWESHHEPDTASNAEGAAAEIGDYVGRLIRTRLKAPGDDVISDLLKAGLSEGETLVMAVLLLNAGHETTVNLLGNAMLALLTHQEAWRELASDTSIATVATEEVLRYDTSVQIFPRRVLEDLEVGGVLLSRCDNVRVVFGSANRDEEVFERPAELVLRRQPNPQLSFGVGIHTCLGAPLARLEIAEVLSVLAEEWPDIQLSGSPVWRPQLGIRGLSSLPVKQGDGGYR